MTSPPVELYAIALCLMLCGFIAAAEMPTVPKIVLATVSGLCLAMLYRRATEESNR